MTTTFGPYVIGHGTHPGPRESNQDTVLSIGIPDDRWLLAVADGMGGLEEGELASQTALGALYQSLCEGSTLVEAVKEANTAVNQEAKGRVMGTTLVAAVLSHGQAHVVNVGDSRAYNSDLLGLLQVTSDHTMAEEAARTGELLFNEPGEGAGRWAGALARYLGAEEEVEVDSFGPLDLLEGGWLLLCSDGLHGVMSLDDLDAFLAGKADADGAAAGLIEEALARNTGDNVSVALAGWPDASAVPLPPPQPPDPVSPWNPERILIKSPRTPPPTNPVVTAGKIFLVVVPLAIALVFILQWFFSR